MRQTLKVVGGASVRPQDLSGCSRISETRYKCVFVRRPRVRVLPETTEEASRAAVLIGSISSIVAFFSGAFCARVAAGEVVRVNLCYFL
ncbi:hypothetical protein GWI33_003621 [Rhynchophorus ferrugineus]|uniref:Uncharacterized protein n=1 Tax=Rhynchophorus ferrugineus TaxID=354439 RepID=A0A834HK96_RHYFE|nr:hypothetical protein GWI33_003621 [Rhynchophorus ferrugineus]